MAQKIQNKINLIIKEFQDGNLEVAEKLAINFKDKYPKNDFVGGCLELFMQIQIDMKKH